MTKNELAEKMKTFIEMQPNYDKDDWYLTTQEVTVYVLNEFAEFLKINLNEPKKEN